MKKWFNKTVSLLIVCVMVTAVCSSMIWAEEDDGVSLENLYKSVLANIVLDDGETAQYGLADINGDGIVELFVNIIYDHLGTISIYTLDGSEIVKVGTPQYFKCGVAPVGGYRAGMMLSSDNSLFHYEWMSVYPEVSVSEYVLKDNSLVVKSTSEYHRDTKTGTAEYNKFLASGTAIEWLDIPEIESLKLTSEEKNSFANTTDSFYNISDETYKKFQKGKLDDIYEAMKNEEFLFCSINKELIDKSYESRLINLSGGGKYVYMILNEERKYWGGSCYGMAATMILAGINEVDLNSIETGVSVYSELSKPFDSQEVKDFINYYQIAQILPVVIDSDDWVSLSSESNLLKNKEEERRCLLEKLVKRAQEVDLKGPSMLNIDYEDDEQTHRHGVIINGCNVVMAEGGYIIEVVNPNFKNSPYNEEIEKSERMWISSDYKNFYIMDDGEKFVTEGNVLELEFSENMSMFDVLSGDGLVSTCDTSKGTNFYLSSLDSDDDVTVTNKDGIECQVKDGIVVDDASIENYNYIGDDISSTLMFELVGDDFTINSEEGIDISMSNRDLFYSVEGEGVSQTDFNAEGISVINDSSAYEISVPSPTEEAGILILTGSGNSLIEVTENDDGVLITGDSLDGVIISTYNGVDTSTYDVNTDSSSLLVKGKDGDDTGVVELYTKADGEYNKLGETTVNDGSDSDSTGFEAFLCKDSESVYYEYAVGDLNNAYLAYQINPSLSTAKMYQQFLDSGSQVVALKDGAKGYMDYQSASSASLMAQIKGQSFDINSYLSGSEAKAYSETVVAVKTVDKDGNISE